LRQGARQRGLFPWLRTGIHAGWCLVHVLGHQVVNVNAVSITLGVLVSSAALSLLGIMTPPRQTPHSEMSLKGGDDLSRRMSSGSIAHSLEPEGEVTTHAIGVNGDVPISIVDRLEKFLVEDCEAKRKTMRRPKSMPVANMSTELEGSRT
jgi:hypothetical protein